MQPKNFATYGYGPKGAIPDGSLRLDWADGPDTLYMVQETPFTKRWAAFEAPAGGIRLADASPSLPITNTEGIDSVLFSTGTFRRISLGFDRNSRPVIATENSAGGTITVRWYWGGVQTISFPGKSPRVLFNGLPSLVEGYNNSDTIVYYLNAAGDQLLARSFFDSFSFVYTVLNLATPLKELTKIDSMGTKHVLWAMSAAGSRAGTEQVTLHSDTYPAWTNPCAYTPPSGMVMWFKANIGPVNGSGLSCQDGEAVTTWLNQSGTQDATQILGGATKPEWFSGVLNGWPIIRFTPGTFLNVPHHAENDIQTDITIFAVFRVRDLTVPCGPHVIISKGLAGIGKQYEMRFNTNDPRWYFAGNFPCVWNGATCAPQDSWHYVIARNDNTGGTYQQWTDGVTVLPASSSCTMHLVGTGPTPVGIGNNQDNYTTTNFVDIAEIGVFDRGLTTGLGGEIDQVNNYLACKYLL